MFGKDARKEAAELVVLSLLADGPKYGYLLSKEAAGRTEGALRLTPGVLYPLLKAMEENKLVVATWEEVKAAGADEGDAGRSRRWYRLTAKGRKRLDQRVTAHKAYRTMMDAFLGGGGPREEASS